MTCPGWFNMELPNEASFPLSSRCYDHCKKCLVTIFIAAVVRETYSFIKIMQPISPNNNWENGVKQTKIVEEHLSQSSKLYLMSIAKDKEPSIRVKMHQIFFFFYFYHYLPYLASFCTNPLNLKNKITKIDHKKIFCGPSKVLKNNSWPINVCLKYFMTPTKTLRTSLLYI